MKHAIRALLLAFLLIPASAQATVEFLLTPTVSWTTPGGVTTTQAECIGPGGDGSSALPGGGGGGGGYGLKTGIAVSGSVTVQVGARGSLDDCFFKTSGTVAGAHGVTPSGGGGASGGAGGAGTGDTAFTGGTGGNSATGSGGGGAGAAGPFAAGNNGSVATGVTGGAGGQGDGTHGGLGGAAHTNGVAGTEFDASHGSGGGGGGAGSVLAGGSGGNYGAGGGGNDAGDDGQGNGTNGLIILTYTAVTSTKRLLLLNVGALEDAPDRVLMMSSSDLMAREWLWGQHANDNLIPLLTVNE